MKWNKRVIVYFSILSVLSFFVYAQEPFRLPYKNYQFVCGKQGGSLYLFVTSDPKSFNPIVSQESTTNTIISFVFQGLTETDPLTLEVKPSLAKSWQTKDGKTWIFNLRNDVFWHDGKKFTADDVIFTFNDLVYNPKIPCSSRDIFIVEGKSITVEKIDDYTVSFKLPFIFAPFLRALSQPILPKHKYYQEVIDGKFTFSLGLGTKLTDIVGTGPFILKQYLPGERVVLGRNKLYFKQDAWGNKLPYLEEIVFTILASQDTALLKFMEAELDYYDLRPMDLAILGPKQEKDKFTIYNAGPSLASNFLILNQNFGKHAVNNKPFIPEYKYHWFRNRKFRQAIAYAINRDKMIEVLMNGLGAILHSPESQANKLFYNDDVKKYPYNPEKAKRFLKKLGFNDLDQDGFLEDNLGHKLEITFLTNSEDQERVKMATMVKQDLENIGIKIHFVPLQFNNLVNKLTVSFDWEMILIGFTGVLDPHGGKNVWSYKGNLHAWNMTKIAKDDYEIKLEKIFDQGAMTLDEKARKKIYDQYQLIASQEVPLIYLVTGYKLYAVKNKFGNLYPTVFGGAFSDIEYIFRL